MLTPVKSRCHRMVEHRLVPSGSDQIQVSLWACPVDTLPSPVTSLSRHTIIVIAYTLQTDFVARDDMWEQRQDRTLGEYVSTHTLTSTPRPLVCTQGDGVAGVTGVAAAQYVCM